jgi:hypothetical protein
MRRWGEGRDYRTFLSVKNLYFIWGHENLLSYRRGVAKKKNWARLPAQCTPSRLTGQTVGFFVFESVTKITAQDHGSATRRLEYDGVAIEKSD